MIIYRVNLDFVRSLFSRSDVANPLIGDVSEYRRFVDVLIEKTMTTPPTPADHGNAHGNYSQLVRKN